MEDVDHVNDSCDLGEIRDGLESVHLGKGLGNGQEAEAAADKAHGHEDFEDVTLENGKEAVMSEEAVKAVVAESERLPAVTSIPTSMPSSPQSPRTKFPVKPSSPATPSPPRKGSSKLEQVISRTRQTTLPPKAREEDQKHIAEWERMMKEAKELEREKKARVEEGKLKKDSDVKERLLVWEQAILPNFKEAVRDKRLRGMWWEGVPSKIRGQVWLSCIQNPLMIPSKKYSELCLKMADRLEADDEQGRLVKKEIEKTLPEMRIFQSGGPLHDELYRLILVLISYRIPRDHLDSLTWLSSVMLLNVEAPQAFLALTNVLNSGVMQAFYHDNREEIEAYLRVFGTLFADALPKLFHHFATVGFKVEPFIRRWFVMLYVQHVSIECTMRIWDILFLEGDSILFRTAISILSHLESRCFGSREEIEKVLCGEDRGALNATLDAAPCPSPRRTRELGHGASLNADGIYSMYGLTSEKLFQEMPREDWKEGNFRRILTRELP